jgi:hypothetical protein
MGNLLQRTWKEAALLNLRCSSGICFERLQEKFNLNFGTPSAVRCLKLGLPEYTKCCDDHRATTLKISVFGLRKRHRSHYIPALSDFLKLIAVIFCYKSKKE